MYIFTEKKWNQVELKPMSLASWVSALTIWTTGSIQYQSAQLEPNIAFQMPHHGASHRTVHTEGDTLCCKVLVLPDVNNMMIYMH